MAKNSVADMQRDYLYYSKSIALKRMRKIAPGMQMMHLRVLKFVGRNPESSQQDLVAISGRDKGQVARMSKDLQNMGLMKRRRDAIDKRRYKLRLTASGERVGEKIDVLFSALGDELSANVDKKQLKVFASVLAIMMETAKKLK